MMELESLNFQEAGSWPLWQKLAVCVLIIALICVGGFFGMWKATYESWENAKREEFRLRQNYTERKIKTVNHDLYIKQLEQIQNEFGALVKNLPSRSEIDALLVDVNQTGIERGLQFELFKPAQNEKKAEFYAEIPIDIKLSGDYHGMGGFVSDVAALPRIVTINDVSIERNRDGVLTMAAVAKTFRYLDEQEQAQQKQAQEQQQGGKK
ncbi:MAG: type 4a pilus biogenesis protein PilO [Burkholderiales bacterium]|jgi:type IV pilus assembly protein PilO|nr:type 4a pilus biogenesis protein PilO [Burkholderiales bacterium]